MTNTDNSAPQHPPQDEFEVWLNGRHKWLQTAGARLLKKSEQLTKEEVSDLADICYGEAIKDTKIKYDTIPAGSFASGLNHQGMQIETLQNVHGLNAVKTGASLSFSTTGLTIVYGINGSGKSSFARLLKNMCGARNKDDLIPDVYQEKIVDPAAEVKISTTGTPIPWNTKTGEIPELRHVHVFDSKAASAYYDQKNEATYEPKKMLFLTALISVADQANAIFGERKKAIVKNLAELPEDLKGTNSENFLVKFSHKTTQAEIDSSCAFSEEEKNQRISLEAALKQDDVAEKLAALALELNQVEGLKQEIENLKKNYSKENAEGIVSVRKEAVEKRKAASEDAKKVFSATPLKGIGEESWKLLWEAARKYSNEQAYAGKSFPVTDEAKCVLCQSDITAESKDRLINFEKFVTGELEKGAKAAEEKLTELVKKLPASPDKEQWLLKMKVIKITDGDSVPDDILEQKKLLESADVLTDYKEISFDVIADATLAAIERIKKDHKTYTDLKDDKKRQEMIATLRSLKAQEWLNGRKAEISKEQERLGNIDNLELAEKLCKTNTLSAKKGEIGEQELAKGYQTRFGEELTSLAGTRIPINTVPQTGGKGKVTFRLTLNGVKHDYPVLRILSEGEIRTVALAAFIADMRGSEMAMPFVFDDPISSLDQEFEERVASRLVELSKERQVIVFTHRLSLLALLEEALKSHNDNAAKSGAKPLEQSVVTLAKFGGKAGVISDVDVRQKRPDKGFRELLDHQVPKLKKLEADGDVAGFKEKMISVCSGYRILIERTVEVNLLSDVVTRFRRSVQTLKIPQLGKIKHEDCELIDALMTKYSGFEHSQSPEINATLPTVKELEEDLTNILAWITEFSGRK